jgi:CRISPR-associated protein Csx10
MSRLTLTLRQPAQVGDRARSDLVLGTHSHLPGMVVRGAFAAAWIGTHGEPGRSSPARAQFLRLFEGGVRFGPLFHAEPFVPLSVLRHKYPRDCAVAEYDRATQDDVPRRCPDCGSPLEQVVGLRDETGLQVRRRTSVAIAASGVASRGQLVTRDTLAAGLALHGHLVAGDPDLIDALAGIGRVRVGGRRTTHGLADVAIDKTAQLPLPERRSDGRLVIRLRSPGVFVDDLGRPSRDPNLSELADALGSQVRVDRRWTRWHTVGGWHVASGLPKPTELAAAPGSTYLVTAAGPVSDDALAALARRGLGLRRHEGFGDLGDAPALRPGRLARDAEARRRVALLDAVAPLRGLQVTRPDVWPPLLAQLASHAAGDAAATAFLRRMAQAHPDASIGAALVRFLEFDLADAAYVAREVGAQ